jgi:murein DD-endopeptidase MepM/ murein hydrolase activator NlpD
MKNIAAFFLLIALIGTSCRLVNNIFEKKTPHEEYADRLDRKDIDETPEGREWIAVSKRVLQDAQTVELPYRQNGYFHADKPHALGLRFKATFGERLTFTLDKKAGTALVIFADVFKQDNTTEPLLSADTANTQFIFDVAETGTYFLRLQPQLHHTGEYKLSVSVGPSLGFPVSGSKASVGSFWGASRDGGQRLHEGIDIFAAKLTPAIAGADGVITGVKEGGLGGKVVWMKVNDKNTFLYYAHLDKQLVTEGQLVRKGDVVGLVGNTGNAKHTASHLHFGVYTNNGAVNPLPFVNRTIKNSSAVPEKNLSSYLKLIKTQKTEEGIVVAANTGMVPLAVNAKGYFAELPDGNIIHAPFTSVKASLQPVKLPVQPAVNVASR